MSTSDIDSIIAGLNYDPAQVLSVVPDGTTTTQPDRSRVPGSNAVIIATTRRHTLQKNLSEVAILSPSAVAFPGALLRADRALMDGTPTPIALPRAKAVLTIDLPGLANPSTSIEPSESAVTAFLNDRLEAWNRLPQSQGYRNANRTFLNVTTAYSKQQVALDLGFAASWASGNASAQLEVSSSSEKSVVVCYYKQVFYTVSMDTPASPGAVFAPDLPMDRVRGAILADHPPAYVRSVDYGRILLVRMETTTTDTSVNLQGAFKQATQGGVTVSGDLKAKYDAILKNANFTVVAIGGGTATTTEVFNGAAQGDLKGLQTYFAAATYSRDNPGLPIAYTVAFLKDNAFAKMGFTTDYTETEYVRYPNGFIRFHHSGAYVAKFHATWQEPTGTGQTIPRAWESGKQTAGYDQTVNIPGDAQNLRLRAEAATGLVWNPWGEIMDIHLDGPSNKTYRVTGTTLNRHWDNG
ncbi:thiol-activated cytolysin family protein [Paracraurococcus ruber]|nr:thiol-activated cytolysin family protein [Paracraurococcus ruber]